MAAKQPWSIDWQFLWRAPAMKCEICGRIPARSPRRPRNGSPGVRLQGAWYCRTECLELAICAMLDRDNAPPVRSTAAHRIPLGLLLLSRHQVTADQLRTALDLQRAAGSGKIGEWLQHLGVVGQEQVTGALARQWSCPVLRIRSSGIVAHNFTSIPLALLEASQMVPAEFVEATGSLLMAFSNAVDYTALYAIDQMLGCRTEACFVCPGVLQEELQAILQVRRPTEVVFDRIEDAGECARIISSYSGKMGAEAVRLIRVGKHVWIRLERPLRETVNLILPSPPKILSQASAHMRAASQL
jgi:Type II secretion system (T2SS), protein E, N-terminal domain